MQRPLQAVWEQSGDRIARGVAVPSLPRDKAWHFVPDPQLPAGSMLAGGSVLGTVQETESILHRILTPPLIHGELLELAPEGDYTMDEAIGRVRLADGRIEKLHLFHRWPVRTPRPFKQRDHAVAPLITGQRILDTFYPLFKGGKAAIPGPFGAGKTMLQQQIARWCNAEIVIYVGCGERGNELTDVLESMPELKDPHTGRPLMERTLLVANTSNMPVVAREASIYVGITLAEYFRDQGYDVVMVADSTSRWAEALREVAGRLGQMPVEEGYPAYLGSRLAAFYERAGRVETCAGDHGSVTLIGAVSPPGGDFSEPVTSHTKEIIQTFWALVEGTGRRAPLPGGRLAGELFRLREFRCEVVGGTRRSELGRRARRGARSARCIRRVAAHRQPGRRRGAVERTALDAGNRRADQGRPAAAVGHSMKSTASPRRKSSMRCSRPCWKSTITA